MQHAQSGNTHQSRACSFLQIVQRYLTSPVLAKDGQCLQHKQLVCRGRSEQGQAQTRDSQLQRCGEQHREAVQDRFKAFSCWAEQV